MCTSIQTRAVIVNEINSVVYVGSQIKESLAQGRTPCVLSRQFEASMADT